MRRSGAVSSPPASPVLAVPSGSIRSTSARVVGVLVRVPDELAVDLDDGELVVVERPDDAGLERGIEQGELLGEVDLGLHSGKGVRP